MRPVRLDKVKVGDVLGKSLFNDRGELMLAAGYELTQEMLDLMHKRGYRQVYIVDEFTANFKPLEVVGEIVRQSVTKRLKTTFESALEQLKNNRPAPDQLKRRLIEDDNLQKLVPMGEVSSAVSELLDEILENNIPLLTSLPIKSAAGKTYEHALDTAVLAVLLAQQYNYDYKELKSLGTAALVHDVGKTAFGPLAEKPAHQYTSQERWLMREHPTYSMLMIKGSDPHSYIEQTTVLQHHERPDGKGYPQGLRGLNMAPLKVHGGEPGYIFRHAEILAVANAYDNLISGEWDGNFHTPQSAVSQLVTRAGSEYNPHVLRALTKVVQFYPTGSEVRVLNTFSGDWVGYGGFVKEANPHEFSKPVLLLTQDERGHSIDPETVDLKSERAAYLELVL